MKMEATEEDKCCCGCSVEAGTKTIAFLQTFIAVLITLVCITGAIYVNNMETIPSPDGSGFYVGIVIGIFSSTSGVILLVGAMEKRPHLLYIWIMISFGQLALYAIGDIFQIFMLMISGRFSFGMAVLIISLAGIMISYYYISVVTRFRKEVIALSATNVV